MRLYHHVGPPEIAGRIAPGVCGNLIESPKDARMWVESNEQSLSSDVVMATFVVDAHGRLSIANRRSEHVACAGGAPVLAAGELTIEMAPALSVLSVSNQSTGYCPAVDSWPAVARAIADIGLAAPEGYDPACEFRRCNLCKAINLVKDNFYQCSLCEATLPSYYNVQ